MSIATSLEAEPRRATATGSGRALEWSVFVLVVGTAAGLRLWGLDKNEFGNTYYAAAVRGMLASSSNFFFGSFDPGGYVTVDKPPVALWLQAVFAAVLGYKGVNLLLPQALAGVAAVIALIRIVGRVSGRWAGLVAGFVLAISPMTVAVDRDNLPDSLLTLVLVIAAGALLRGAETGRARWLMLSAALVGVGFNVKMLAAFVVLPTFYLVYLLGAATSLKNRLVHLTLATILLAGVSLSWAVVVDLTPKDKRPYMGGSTNNSALNLALGYNGLGRLFGGANNPMPGGGGPGGPPGSMPPPMPGGMRGFPGGPPGGPGGFGGMAMGLMPFAGATGPFRMLMPEFAGQISWMFPFIAIGLVSAALRIRPWIHSGSVGRSLLLWLGWLMTHIVVFSFSQGIIHPYYVTIMSPAVAALTGHGLVSLVADFREGKRRSYLIAAIGATALWQCLVVGVLSESWRVWLIPLVLVGAVAALAPLIKLGVAESGAELVPRSKPFALALAGGLIATCAAPFSWALTPVLGKGNSLIPAADPALLSDGPRFEPPGFGMGDNEKLVTFLRANRKAERFLLATANAPPAASIIIQTGEPVMAIGGFMGGDPILTKGEFAEKVAAGEIRFVQLMGDLDGPAAIARIMQSMFNRTSSPADEALTTGDRPGPSDKKDEQRPMFPPPGFGPGGPPGMPGMRTEVQEWVRKHGKLVDPALWKSEDSEKVAKPSFGPFGAGDMKLYDCRPELGLKSISPTNEGGAR